MFPSFPTATGISTRRRKNTAAVRALPRNNASTVLFCLLAFCAATTFALPLSGGGVWQRRNLLAAQMPPPEGCRDENVQHLGLLNSQNSSGAYQGSTAATANCHTPACGGKRANDQGFVLEVEGGLELRVRLTSASYAALYEIRVEGEYPGDDPVACVADPDFPFISYTNANVYTETVYIIVDGYGEAAGDFDLLYEASRPVTGYPMTYDILVGFDDPAQPWLPNEEGAVEQWIDDPVTAVVTYGLISTWDTHRVTDMTDLFNYKAIPSPFPPFFPSFSSSSCHASLFRNSRSPSLLPFFRRKPSTTTFPLGIPPPCFTFKVDPHHNHHHHPTHKHTTTITTFFLFCFPPIFGSPPFFFTFFSSSFPPIFGWIPPILNPKSTPRHFPRSAGLQRGFVLLGPVQLSDHVWNVF